MKFVGVTLTILFLAAFVGAGIFYAPAIKNSLLGSSAPETVAVSRNTVEETLEFKGHIESEKKVQLGFETSGVIEEVYVGVGDTIKQGQSIARLDSRVSELKVAELFAQRASKQKETLTALENAQKTAEATGQEETRVLDQKRQTVRSAKAELDQVKTVWEQTVRERGDESSLSRAAYADVLSANTAYTAAQKDLESTEKALAKTTQAATNAVESAQTAYEATVKAARGVDGLSALAATEQIGRVQLSKDILTAPFDGTVTAKAVEPGEIAMAGEPLIVLQMIDNKEIVADVDEIDIPGITIGMPASVALDAYPGERWAATVTSIDPAGVFKNEDKVTYRVKLRFTETDERFMPALTSRITIQVAKKDNVLSVPQRAVYYRSQGAFVQVIGSGGAIEEVQVTPGIIGTNGFVEIMSGLHEGQVVVRSLPSE